MSTWSDTFWLAALKYVYRVYICMYVPVCMYVCMYVYMYVCLYACIMYVCCTHYKAEYYIIHTVIHARGKAIH